MLENSSMCFFNLRKIVLQIYGNKAKDYALSKEDQIILDSDDVEDCVTQMNDAVDDFVKDFTETDDFFKEPPLDALEDLKTLELEPIFREDYVYKIFKTFLFVIFFFFK